MGSTMKHMCTWHTCQKPAEKDSYLCAYHTALEKSFGRTVYKRTIPRDLFERCQECKRLLMNGHFPTCSERNR